MKAWPELDYGTWKETYETLHRWLQLVGKLRTYYSPWMNHCWNSALYISSRGFTTSAIPLKDRNLTIDLDLIDHVLKIQDSKGQQGEFPLVSESVASFYQRFTKLLSEFGLEPAFSKVPNEVMDATPLDQDTKHCTYNPIEANCCFEVMVLVSNLMQEVRPQFEGKSSPVHFFWGSFDLALTFFSGRKAPTHPGGIPHLSDEITRESYSHEVMSCGFWPGNEMYPKAAFYAYAYPTPHEIEKIKLTPRQAYYHPELKEFLLDYDEVRKGDSAQLVKDFFQSAFESITKLADWQSDVLELSPELRTFHQKAQEHRQSLS